MGGFRPLRGTPPWPTLEGSGAPGPYKPIIAHSFHAFEVTHAYTFLFPPQRCQIFFFRSQFDNPQNPGGDRIRRDEAALQASSSHPPPSCSKPGPRVQVCIGMPPVPMQAVPGPTGAAVAPARAIPPYHRTVGGGGSVPGITFGSPGSLIRPGSVWQVRQNMLFFTYTNGGSVVGFFYRSRVSFFRPLLARRSPLRHTCLRQREEGGG